MSLIILMPLVLLAWQATSAAREPQMAAVPHSQAAEMGRNSEGRARAAGVSARVWIEPEDAQVGAGETFTVTLMVEGARDLAGYELQLDYDPAALTGLNAEDASFLGSTGRAVTELGPQIDDEDGSLTFAAYSASTTQPGVDGTGPLAVITMEAVTPVNTSALLPQDVSLFDSEGQAYDRVAIGSWRLYLPLVLRTVGP